MGLNHRFFSCLVVLAALSIGGVATAIDRPYTEGPVSVVTSIRTENGMFDDYVAWLAGRWKQEMDAQKKAGIVLDYRVYVATPRNSNEPDLYLEVIYKNWASFDGLTAKLDPITEKFAGSLQKSNAEMAARGKLRRVLGDEVIQQLILK
jgi:hypothetical protein